MPQQWGDAGGREHRCQPALGIGGGNSRSTASTHNDTAYGSRIGGAGNVAIAAAKGALNIIGSQANGNNVTLARATASTC